jgi:hypothetical protein
MINLPQRSEYVVKLQAKERSPLVGILERHQIQEGGFMSGVIKQSDGRLCDNYNTNDVEAEFQEPSVQLDDNEPVDSAVGIATGYRLDDR